MQRAICDQRSLRVEWLRDQHACIFKAKACNLLLLLLLLLLKDFSLKGNFNITWAVTACNVVDCPLCHDRWSTHKAVVAATVVSSCSHMMQSYDAVI